MNDLVITPITATDAEALSSLLCGDDEEYRQYFIPFPADPESLIERLRQVRQDRYWGLWFNQQLAGFFMLRGFDEGFMRPSFGVYIAKAYGNRGLSVLALDFSQSWCRLNNLAAMMLKVHPDNRFARQVYEKADFTCIESCPRTGHTVMEKRWDWA